MTDDEKDELYKRDVESMIEHRKHLVEFMKENLIAQQQQAKSLAKIADYLDFATDNWPIGTK